MNTIIDQFRGQTNHIILIIGGLSVILNIAMVLIGFRACTCGRHFLCVYLELFSSSVDTDLIIPGF